MAVILYITTIVDISRQRVGFSLYSTPLIFELVISDAKLLLEV